MDKCIIICFIKYRLDNSCFTKIQKIRNHKWLQHNATNHTLCYN